MKTLDEIHNMIATADIGDGDRVLDICQALLDRLRVFDARNKPRHDAGNCEVCAAQQEAEALGAIPTLGHSKEGK